jgi:hypothetical protein
VPYIVTATTFTPSGRRAVPGGAEVMLSDSTRRAVATLDEANEALYAIVKERYDSCRVGVPAGGGTVGPLPDGTLITVERVGC